MIFTELNLNGAYVIDPELITDERGFFARTWCQQEFADRNLCHNFVQCSISFNKKQGTLRGMHFQSVPFAETKLVRCTRGAIYDVILDLRRDSPTFRSWAAVQLDESNRRLLYVPAGFAHGFQTLVDNSEVFYQISEFYHPECSSGVRWNDPAFGIEWPTAQRIIAAKDLAFADFTD
jgi:dTDP-4-dehydrorhamnose 3,5-epimerase